MLRPGTWGWCLFVDVRLLRPGACLRQPTSCCCHRGEQPGAVAAPSVVLDVLPVALLQLRAQAWMMQWCCC